jgi:hypothetical protein
MTANSLEELVHELHPERLIAMKHAIEEQIGQHAVPIGDATAQQLGDLIVDTMHNYKPKSWTIDDLVPPFKSTVIECTFFV